MEIKCKKCGKGYSFENSKSVIGTKVSCSACSTVFKVENPNLQPCPDCFELISKRALTCPHCGCALNRVQMMQEELITVCNPSLKYYFWHIILGIVTIPLVFGIFYLLWIWFKNKFTSYEITNLRIIVRTGFIAKIQNEIWIKDMRGVNLAQSFWERIFRIGNIQIGTAANESNEISMIGIAKPQQVVDMINNLRNAGK